MMVVVIGVLAVTRSLGDSSMKDYVVGSPYTTETELCDVDEFLIIACDGVRVSSFPPPLSTLDRVLMGATHAALGRMRRPRSGRAGAARARCPGDGEEATRPCTRKVFHR